MKREDWLAEPNPPPEERKPERPGPGACDENGCIGPFTNQTFQRALGAGMSYGDCMECGRRVLIKGSSRGFESLGLIVEAILAPPADEQPILYAGPERRRLAR